MWLGRYERSSTETPLPRLLVVDDEEDALIGEVSTANDDYADNFFLKEYARFPLITEDEAPKYLLVGDYQAFLQRASPFGK